MMEDFFVSRGINLDSSLDSDATIKSLNLISREMTPDNLGQEPAHRQTKIFHQLWKYLLAVYEKPNSSIKVMVSSLTGKLLTRFIPNFSPPLRKATYDISLTYENENKSSVLLAAIFCYFVRSTSPNKFKELQKFFHAKIHFMDVKNPNFSNIPQILTRIGKFNLQWMSELLDVYLGAVTSSQDRPLFNSILAIIKIYPSLSVSALTNILSNEKPNMDLVSFLLSSTDLILTPEIESKMIDYAFSLLKNENATFIQKDSAFQILLRTPSLQVKNEGDLIHFQNNENIVTFKFDFVKYVASFYLFEIPDLIKVTPNDSPLIAQNKWITAGNLGMISEFLGGYGDRPELLSPFLTGLKHLIRVYKDDNQFAELVHQYIFEKPTSWFHSADMLKVMAEISAERAKNIFGLEQTVKMGEIAIEHISSDNEKLSSIALEFLCKFNPPHEILNLLFAVDFFDRKGFLNIVKMLNVIQLDENCNALFQALLESVDFYIDDQEVLQALFAVSARFDLKVPLHSLIVAKAMEFCRIFLKKFSSSDFDDYFTNNFDSCNGSLDFTGFFTPLSNALIFLSKVSALNEEVISIVQKCAPFCPKECTCIVKGQYPGFDDNLRERLSEVFVSVSRTCFSVAYMSEWCHLLDGWIRYKDEMKQLCIDVLSVASWFTKEQKAGFALFLIRTCGFSKEELKFIEEAELNEILDYFAHHHPDAYFHITGEKYVEPEKVEVIKKFHFKEPTDLEKRRSEESALFSMVSETVSDEYLQENLENYLKTSNHNGLRALLAFCRRRQRKLIFGTTDIPLLMVMPILTYAAVMMLPELPELGERFRHLNGLIGEKCRILAPTVTIEQFFEMSKPKRAQMRELMTLIHGLYPYANHEMLNACVLHIVDTCNNKRRMRVGLHLFRALLSAMTSVPREFLFGVTSVLNNSLEILDPYETTHVIYLISQKSEINKGVYSIYAHIYPKIRPSFPAHPMIRLAMLNSSLDAKTAQSFYQTTEQVYTSNASSLSLLLMTLRLFLKCIQLKDDQPTVNATKAFLGYALLTIQKRWTIPAFNEVMGPILIYIMSKPVFTTISDVIIKFIVSVVPSPSNAAFQSYAQILPRAVKRGYLLPKRTHSSIAVPLQDFKIEMACLRELIENTATDFDSRSALITDRVTTWLENCYDCYHMANVVYEWQNLILQYLGAQEVVSVVCFQFHKFLPRFFPLFVAMAMFLRRQQRHGEDVSDTLDMIESVVRTKAHRAALKLLSVPGKMGAALKLASFIEDCDESDDIVAKFN